MRGRGGWGGREEGGLSWCNCKKCTVESSPPWHLIKYIPRFVSKMGFIVMVIIFTGSGLLSLSNILYKQLTGTYTLHIPPLSSPQLHIIAEWFSLLPSLISDLKRWPGRTGRVVGVVWLELDYLKSKLMSLVGICSPSYSFSFETCRKWSAESNIISDITTTILIEYRI